jgi:hypothetical protein
MNKVLIVLGPRRDGAFASRKGSSIKVEAIIAIKRVGRVVFSLVVRGTIRLVEFQLDFVDTHIRISTNRNKGEFT